MTEEKTNHENFRDELLADPEMKAKYILSREKIKLEMMLEMLRYQVLEEKSRRTILSQISKISNRLSKIYL